MPFNAFIMWKLKRDEQHYQHKLDVIAKERELVLQHRLEMKQKEQERNEMAELRAVIRQLEQRFSNE